MSVDSYRRLCRGLAVVSSEGKLIIAGAHRRQVFRGKAASDTLPRLLTLLDGSRSGESLRTELDLSRAQLAQALNALSRGGVLEASGPAAKTEAPEHVRTYLSRTVGMSGYATSEALLDDLADTGVYVAGEADSAAIVADDLRECGIGRVGSGSLTEPEADSLRVVERPLVIVLDSPGGRDALADAVDLCGPRGIPVLRVAEDRDYLEIGPCFFPDYTACPACLRRARGEAGWDRVPGGSGRSSGLLLGLAASEAFTIAAKRPTVPALRTVQRIKRGDWSTERHLATPYRDCSCTGSSRPPAGGPPMSVPETFEWSMERPAPPCLRPTDPPAGEVRSWEPLLSRRPAFPGRPSRRLDAEHHIVHGEFGASARSTETAVSEPLLTDIMRRVAGLRQAPESAAYQRWAPTGGGLASVELYLCTENGLSGLPGTVFRYDDLAHRIIAVRPDSVPLSEAVSGTDLPAARMSAALVFTAAHERLAEKYGAFAHRLSHLDAGCASSQLAAVAKAHGLAVEFAARWDGRIGELLDLRPESQYVTAVAGILRPNPDR